MNIALITGSAGLVGSQAAEFFLEKGFRVEGVDNDMRRTFFGDEASTMGNRERLQRLPSYAHHDIDIRDSAALEKIFQEFRQDIMLIIHAAGQPSHDWAGRDPETDFHVNAVGTLNLLELTRRHCPQAVFIFLSTNKVYGDRVNELPLTEQATRWEVDPRHPCHNGVAETMGIDQSMHSFFGASKTAADILVQEYGRYLVMKTVCFRAGCVTGPYQSGAELHGFLAYLIKCCVLGRPYTIFGYKGKQVRDNIHSHDLVSAFFHFYNNPRPGEVYNIGGGRKNNCSLREAIELAEKVTGRKLKTDYNEQNRPGDHMWYVSDLRKFKDHYPEWEQTFDLQKMVRDIYLQSKDRWEEKGRTG
ncbi:MAG: NAD-dependent epimerase/dehydratase family protein [Candidatus Omnitrophota bacterium]|nr:NAD-dependent epimerase/dehydratase family protein [Candidatus Omnitrophota bacterium]MDZ4241494.1 NAD-dependent epimerase/dehydratase family protein [Candidatus Omnitrophota bacterium]